MKVKHETAVHCDWNVLTSPWMEVMSHNAVPDVVSPLHALTHAKEYRCITSGSPLDLFSAHRFLLTLLYWKAEVVGGVVELRSSLLAGDMPDSVVEAIKAEEGCFNLFDPEKPFLQDIEALSSKKTEAEKRASLKSPGSFFAELASGSNIAHFHHGDDKEMVLCLKCTTLGMLRLVPWSQAGGSGISPSIHGAPPIMAVVLGSSLIQTLGLNLIELDCEAGKPRWTGYFKPSDREKAVDYLEALTWNPRRVLLSFGGQTHRCWDCGQKISTGVGRIAYQKNEHTRRRKKNKKGIPFIWHDPASFYSREDKFTSLISPKEINALDFSDLLRITESNSDYSSDVTRHNQDHSGFLLTVPCVKPGDNKTYDHRQVVLDSFTPEALHAVTPELVEHETDKDLSGWDLPRPQDRPVLANRSRLFVNAASSLFTETDWAVFASAAFKSIDQATEAFDLFSGLYWGLRKGKQGVPRRNTGWLVLKLMASVPTAHRKQINEASFNPLDDIPRQQLNYEKKPGSVKVIYPVSFPTGNSLEQCLRDMLIRNTREQQPQLINWAGLCYSLDILLNQNTV